MSHHLPRRRFLEKSLKTAALLPVTGILLNACSEEANEPVSDTPAPLNILILGGTSFLGPHQIDYALKRGHKITTFTRGKSKPTVHQDIFDQVESLVGDRKDNLEALKGRKWDVVIDNSGRDVTWTEATAELLKDNVDLYVYTSSTGVFYPYTKDSYLESDEVLLEEPEGIEDEDVKIEYWYGVMKANSELAAIRHFGEDRTIVVRPTYMLGPGDKTDRFTYWPVRLAQGGQIFAPGKSTDPVQYIDVRDVAEWMIRLIEEKNTGTYNAVGPAEATDMEGFLAAIKPAFETEVEWVRVEDYEFLKEQGVPYLIPWILPEGNQAGSALASTAKAKANGITYRDFAQTVRDIHEWWVSDAVDEERRAAFLEGEDGIMAAEQRILKVLTEKA